MDAFYNLYFTVDHFTIDQIIGRQNPHKSADKTRHKNIMWLFWGSVAVETRKGNTVYKKREKLTLDDHWSVLNSQHWPDEHLVILYTQTEGVGSRDVRSYESHAFLPALVHSPNKYPQDTLQVHRCKRS